MLISNAVGAKVGMGVGLGVGLGVGGRVGATGLIVGDTGASVGTGSIAEHSSGDPGPNPV